MPAILPQADRLRFALLLIWHAAATSTITDTEPTI